MQCMQPARAAAALLLAALAASQPYLPDAYSEYQGSAPSRMALSAFSKLKKSPEWVASWPEPLELGQVSAVSVDRAGRVHLFHRGERRWRADTFDFTNHYLGPAAPISQPTVLVLNSTGELLDTWAQDMFFMPHGLTVDSEDNVWLTDVALHQVFKFAPGDRKTPALQLGVRFSPGDDESHFCKPSAVAVLASGEFFVADGYCNTRIIKHSRDGRRILEWGKENPPAQGVPPPYALLVPHALTLAEERGLVCAADRENGRVQCFHASNGTFHSQYHSWLIGGRLFSLVYSPRGGGRLYVVNGPTPSYRTVRGFVIDFDSGRLIQYFGPNGHGLENPHDIAVSPDGQSVYVVELDPHKVHKFVEAIGKNETQQAGGGDKRLQPEQSPAPAGSSAGSGVSEQMRPRAQPAATLEEASVVYTGAAASWGAWLGVAGGAAGGLGAVLICALAAGVALLRARRTGKEHHKRTEAEALMH